MNQNAHFGKFGEKLAAEYLRRNKPVRVFRPSKGDVGLVSDNGKLTLVEVKTARKSTAGYVATLWKRGSQDYSYADRVCLLVLDDDLNVYVFFIPVSVLGKRSTLKITSHPTVYRGKWADYYIGQSTVKDLLQ